MSIWYTTRYMIAAIMKAVITSNMECCLINMVDRMMEIHRIKEPVRILLFSASAGVWVTARCAAIELYT